MKKAFLVQVGLLALLSIFLVACKSDTDDETEDTGSSSSTSATSVSGGGNSSSTITPSCSDSSANSITYSFTNASGVTVTYYAKYLIDNTTASYDSTTLSRVDCSSSNEIAFLVVNGGSLTLTGVTINKTGDGAETSSISGDAYNFYGINNAVFVLGSDSTATLSGCKVTTSAKYANAVFASDGGTIEITNGITITTTGDSSRGLFASYSGTVEASDGGVNITTSGSHCAPLATDRGSGEIIVGSSASSTASRVTSEKNDSPCVYSTGTITAYNLTGTCTSGQAVVVEGLNNVNLSSCTFTGARSGQGCIMLYQSESGDSSSGNSSLTITNCTFNNSLASSSEPMFYVTNTTAVITISGCTFNSYTSSSSSVYSANNAFILCEENSDNSWGTSGSNGGVMQMTATGETLTGTVCAAESDSKITVTCGTSNLSKKSGSGTITVNGTTL